MTACHAAKDCVPPWSCHTADRKNKNPFGAASPAARSPVRLAGGHLLHTPLHAPPARCGSPPERPAARRSAARRRLDRLPRRGEGESQGALGRRPQEGRLGNAGGGGGEATCLPYPATGVSAGSLYSSLTLSLSSHARVSSDTCPRSRAMTSQDLGQVECGCG